MNIRDRIWENIEKYILSIMNKEWINTNST